MVICGSYIAYQEDSKKIFFVKSNEHNLKLDVAVAIFFIYVKHTVDSFLIDDRHVYLNITIIIIIIISRF